MPALLGGSARAAAYLSFVSIPYFGAGVLTLVDPDARIAGMAELFFATLLFVATMYFARQRGLRDSARAAPPPCGCRLSHADSTSSTANPRALTRMAGRKLAP